MRAANVLPLVVALLLGGAAAAGLVACGKSDHLIPSSSASALDRQLAAVKDSVDAGECDTVGDDLQKLDSSVANLPKSVDSALRDRLRNGVDSLSKRAPGACLAVDTVVITTPSVTTPAEPETTTSEPPPVTEPDTTTTEPPPETQPPPTTTPGPEPEPTPTPTPNPDDPGTSGGAVAP